MLHTVCIYIGLFTEKNKFKNSLQKYLNTPLWTSIFGKNFKILITTDFMTFLLVSKPMSTTMSMKDLMDAVVTTLHI